MKELKVLSGLRVNKNSANLCSRVEDFRWKKSIWAPSSASLVHISWSPQTHCLTKSRRLPKKEKLLHKNVKEMHLEIVPASTIWTNIMKAQKFSLMILPCSLSGCFSPSKTSRKTSKNLQSKSASREINQILTMWSVLKISKPSFHRMRKPRPHKISINFSKKTAKHSKTSFEMINKNQ